jgi:putative transposase
VYYVETRHALSLQQNRLHYSIFIYIVIVKKQKKSPVDKFLNKYRVSSTRLQHWYYSWAAVYFITICTKNKEFYFGDVANGEMQLSHLGLLADVFWQEIKSHANNVALGAFSVMPNHVHGVLILHGSDDDYVETAPALSLTANKQTIGQKRFQNQGKNTVSSIIGSYKSAVTKHANRLEYPFGWQARFHDHIIRDENSFQTISNYIITNAQKWKEDRFNPLNTK